MRSRPSRSLRTRLQWTVLRENLRRRGCEDMVRDHRAALKGELPPPTGEGVLFAACDDGYYARFAADLVFSAEATGHSHRVHIHLYNPSPETLAHAGVLRKSLVHTRLTCSWEGTEYERFDIDPVIYFAATRFIMTQHLLEASQSPVLSVDIDGFVHRPLGEAFDLVRAADATFHFRLTERRIWRRILAAAVGFNYSPAALAFCRRTARATMASYRQRPDFHTDQIVLYHMYRFARRWLPGIHWQHLPLGLVDYDFRDDSFIWTAKGARKDDATFVRIIGDLQERFSDQYDALPPLDRDAAAGA